MRLQCKKCGHVWNYKGDSARDEYVTCSKCHYKYLRKTFEEEYKNKGTKNRLVRRL